MYFICKKNCKQIYPKLKQKCVQFCCLAGFTWRNFCWQFRHHMNITYLELCLRHLFNILLVLVGPVVRALLETQSNKYRKLKIKIMRHTCMIMARSHQSIKQTKRDYRIYCNCIIITTTVVDMFDFPQVYSNTVRIVRYFHSS